MLGVSDAHDHSAFNNKNEREAELLTCFSLTKEIGNGSMVGIFTCVIISERGGSMAERRR